ncbi:hypothetical protein ACH5RR_034721 [Cinchona calisaya]|uniref:RING-type E3 ubiquitin transferase n=1 Tax=Cinchona calisaya TaxID=153742 RepID=A0ABD2YG90_9GENT
MDHIDHHPFIAVDHITGLATNNNNTYTRNAARYNGFPDEAINVNRLDMLQLLMSYSSIFPAPRDLELAGEEIFPVASGADLMSSMEEVDGLDDRRPIVNNCVRGLEEENIMAQLNIRTYYYNDDDGDQVGSICVVCQGEYEDEEKIGRLHCGHEYHVDCIKEWLLHKNFCAVCKRVAIQEHDRTRS